MCSLKGTRMAISQNTSHLWSLLHFNTNECRRTRVCEWTTASTLHCGTLVVRNKKKWFTPLQSLFYTSRPNNQSLKLAVSRAFRWAMDSLCSFRTTGIVFLLTRHNGSQNVPLTHLLIPALRHWPLHSPHNTPNHSLRSPIHRMSLVLPATGTSSSNSKESYASVLNLFISEWHTVCLSL